MTRQEFNSSDNNKLLVERANFFPQKLIEMVKKNYINMGVARSQPSRMKIG